MQDEKLVETMEVTGGITPDDNRPFWEIKFATYFQPVEPDELETLNERQSITVFLSGTPNGRLKVTAAAVAGVSKLLVGVKRVLNDGTVQESWYTCDIAVLMQTFAEISLGLDKTIPDLKSGDYVNAEKRHPDGRPMVEVTNDERAETHAELLRLAKRSLN